MIASVRCVLLLCGILIGVPSASAADYSGLYRADNAIMRVEKFGPDSYRGTLDLGVRSCVFIAKYRPEVGGLPPGYEEPIVGLARCADQDLKFSANLYDQATLLDLHLETEYYSLRRAADETADQTAASPSGRAGDAGQSAPVWTARAAFVLQPLSVTDGGNAYGGSMPGQSARAGLQWVVPQIAGGFEATVVGDAATADTSDSQAQLLFHTTATRTPLRGLVLASRGPDGVQVALVYQNVGKAAAGLRQALGAALGTLNNRGAPPGRGADPVAQAWLQVLQDQNVTQAADGLHFDTRFAALDDFLRAHPEFQRVPVESLLGQR